MFINLGENYCPALAIYYTLISVWFLVGSNRFSAMALSPRTKSQRKGNSI